MKIAAITGARSMLGQHLTRKLEASGVSVVAVGRSKSDTIFMELGGDLPSFSDHNVEADYLFHCAASIAADTPDGIHDNFSINTTGASSVCHLAERLGVKKIIFAGTLSSDEQFDPGNIGSYGLSKKFAEDMFSWWARKRNAQFCGLRLTQLYDTEGRCITHQPWFGRIITYAAHGIDLRLPASLGPRNFLHVEDAAEIMISAALSDVSGILNATHPVSMTMNNIARIAYDVFDSGGQTVAAEEKTPFRKINVPSSASAFEKLNLPQPRSIQDGIKQIRDARTYTSFGPMDVT